MASSSVLRRLSLLTGVCLFASALVLVAAPPAFAATIEVDTTEDSIDDTDGDCTLREAIENANDGAQTINDCAAGTVGMDEITFDDEDETYELDGAADENANVSGDLDITDDLRIEGGGADETILDGGGNPGSYECDGTDTPSDRVLHVLSGADLELEGVTVRNGVVEDTGLLWGGGIFFNSAGDNLTINESTVEDNVVCGLDSGVANDEGNGGGIGFLSSGTLKINGSTVENNQALVESGDNNAAHGGGVAINASTLFDMVTSSNELGSTIANNTAETHGTGGTPDPSQGGGIWIGDNGNWENSTVSGNTAEEGGGVFAATHLLTTLDMLHLTITDNDEDGLETSGGAGVVRPEATIIGEQDAGDDCDLQETNDMDSQGHNLDSDGTCEFTDTGDEENEDPDLSGLDDNGGPTETHLPDDNSPAVNAIDDSDCELDEDQRGEERPDDDDDECDIGSVEHQQSEEDDDGGGGGDGTADDDLDVTPETAENILPVDTQHTLTATLDESALDNDEDDIVNFKVLSGPNAKGGDDADFSCTLSSDVCTATYTSNGVAGTDVMCAWMDTDDDDHFSLTGSGADGGNCDTETLTPPTASDADFTDVVNVIWRLAQCRDTVDNDGDTRVDHPADLGCTSLDDDSENSEGTPTPPPTTTRPPPPGVDRVGSFLTLNFNGRRDVFRGRVSSRRVRCERNRFVTLKHVDRGPNTVVGRDRTNSFGRYRIPVVNPDGRYYAVASRKTFTAANGTTVICRRARSRTLRIVG